MAPQDAHGHRPRRTRPAIADDQRRLADRFYERADVVPDPGGDDAALAGQHSLMLKLTRNSEVGDKPGSSPAGSRVRPTGDPPVEVHRADEDVRPHRRRRAGRGEYRQVYDGRATTGARRVHRRDLQVFHGRAQRDAGLSERADLPSRERRRTDPLPLIGAITASNELPSEGIRPRSTTGCWCGSSPSTWKTPRTSPSLVRSAVSRPRHRHAQRSNWPRCSTP